MQLCPLFCTRAVTAVCAAFSMSADGITTNGSLPPSSSTTGFSSSPAMRPIERPAGVLPVSVAARDARVAQDRVRPTAAPMSNVWNAPSGNPAAAERLLDQQRGLRHVRRVLQQPDVARHQRGRGEPDHLPQREVPRHHREHRSERLVAHVRAGRADRGRVGRFVGEHRLRVLGVEAAPLRALHHLGARRRRWSCPSPSSSPARCRRTAASSASAAAFIQRARSREGRAAGTRGRSPRPGRCARRPRRRTAPRRSSRSHRLPDSSSQWP